MKLISGKPFEIEQTSKSLPAAIRVEPYRTLYTAAIAMHVAGIGEPDLASALLGLNRGCSQQALSEEAVRIIAASVARVPLEDPQSLAGAMESLETSWRRAEQTVRYQVTLQAIAACSLDGMDFKEWVQAAASDALEGLFPECHTCGTFLHAGPCVSAEGTGE